MSSACGCKEVPYIDFHILLMSYPYSSCICMLIFAAASLLFVHF